MRAQTPIVMRPGNDLQATGLRRRVIECDPHSASREGPDRPVLAVLVPGRTLSVAFRLGEQARVPERKVRADELLDHVKDLRRAGDLEESQIVGEQIRAEITKARLALNQALLIGAQIVEHRRRQAEVRYDVAVLAVRLDPGLA